MANTKDASTAVMAVTQAFVTKQFKIEGKPGPVEGGEKPLAVHRFLTEPAKVEVGLGLTLNIGNFESAKISVSITVPCYKEEVEDAYDWAKNWVAERTQAEVKSIRAEFGVHTS